MKCLSLPFGVQPTEQLNRCGLGRGGERKHGNIGLFAVAADLVRNHIFDIADFLIAGAQRHGDCRHILTGGGRMRLVDDNGESLAFQPCNAVHDVRELLNRGRNNFCVAVQGTCKVGRVAFIVHHTDKSGFVLHAHNGFLKLAVDNNAIGDDDDIIENDLIIRIMQRSKPMRQPCDRVRFAGACAVLNQIILRRAILTHIHQQLADHVKLMISWENDIFGLLRFSGQLILAFLRFDEDELADEVEDSILFQNILPHIGDTVLVFEGGVTRTGIDAFAVAHVEWQEKGRVSGKLGGHIDLLQIHRKVHKASSLKAEQSGVRVTINTVLINGILVRLTGGIAFQLKRHDGNAIQEDDQVNTLIIACPDLLHNGENILLVPCQQFPVKGGSGLGVHKLQLHIGDFNAMLQHIQQTAARFCDLSIDEADKGVLQVGFVDFAERRHLI